MGGDSLTKQYSFIDEDDYQTDEETKTCVKCKKALPLTFFSYNSGRPYLRPECKKCNNELTKVREALKEKHGMPFKGYKCPVCLRNEEEVKGLGGLKNGSWVLDHDHETDNFRGWLCHSCNRALGFLNDSKDSLNRAIDYLERLK
jgi:hypothetical protein